MTSSQRLRDWGLSYHVRPLVLALDGRRQAISPVEAQRLLAELGRLPKPRHRAAEETAADMVQGLTAGLVVDLDEDRRRSVLRAIEGIRAGRRLPPGLAALRELLVRSPDAVI